jgi:hypothetical protein
MIHMLALHSSMKPKLFKTNPGHTEGKTSVLHSYPIYVFAYVIFKFRFNGGPHEDPAKTDASDKNNMSNRPTNYFLCPT